MSTSYFELTLDTTPPVLTTFGPPRMRSDRALTIPYALDEPRIAAASIDGRAMEIGSGALRLNNGPHSGVVVLDLIDEVDNAAQVEVPIRVPITGRMAAAVAGFIARAKAGRVRYPRGGRVS